MDPSRLPTFLLFSGHNDRAVLALCRFFQGRGLPFVIAAAGRHDAIHRTAYASQVVFNRTDRSLGVDLFTGLLQRQGHPLVYCPTTEFINHFVLAHRPALADAGLDIGLPDAAVYAQLTSKLASQAVVQGLVGLQPPPSQPLARAHAPCVLKPRANVQSAQVLYPRLCLDEASLAMALAGLDADDWFAQDYIDGQSHYLCGYLARDGQHAWYWQDNLLQQPQGKSIVLARTGENPGLDARRLFDGLHRLGYHGPFMMEVIRDAAGRLHYIEINPRFWGPLQLALDACPQVLALFAQDHGAPAPAAAAPMAATESPRWYAWAHGAQLNGCRRYPQAAALGNDAELQTLLARHDVYRGDDSHALHLTH